MWNSSFEDESSEEPPALRYRPGNRFVPSFSELVDEHIDLFWISLVDGSVGWGKRATLSVIDRDKVAVNVAYREEGNDATASSVWDSAVLLSRWLLTNVDIVCEFEQAIRLGSSFVGF
jgi:hypothetical protein